MADEQEPESEMVKKLRERAAKPLSRVQRRLIEPFSEEDHPLCFQHSVFCQVSLPYRNPGDDNRLWQRRQGNTFLEIEASRVFHPGQQTTVPVVLPWGPKPRLILGHFNGEIMRQLSATIEIENSLTAFVQRIRGFRHGREIRMFKEQLTRVARARRVRLSRRAGSNANAA